MGGAVGVGAPTDHHVVIDYVFSASLDVSRFFPLQSFSLLSFLLVTYRSPSTRVTWFVEVSNVSNVR